MNKLSIIILSFTIINLLFPYKCHAQGNNQNSGYFVSVCVYNGDTIPYMELPTVYVFKPLQFKNEKARREYDKLVRDIKRVLPFSKEVKRILIESYEYIQTLPDTKSKQKHIKAIEKGVKAPKTTTLISDNGKTKNYRL
ncbi:hypothetical protein EZS27_029081 [termite gut metagenome]|uniref:DUF4294 domain-containing protein n=1 Tax=termite gut metagenome TaxID=433724 RepID=A0A5J4QJQ9_9ZZZZ